MTMKFGLLAAGLATALTLTATTVTAKDWKPTGPVSVVVHTGPGGGGDAFARAFITALDRD